MCVLSCYANAVYCVAVLCDRADTVSLWVCSCGDNYCALLTRVRLGVGMARHDRSHRMPTLIRWRVPFLLQHGDADLLTEESIFVDPRDKTLVVLDDVNVDAWVLDGMDLNRDAASVS